MMLLLIIKLGMVASIHPFIENKKLGRASYLDGRRTRDEGRRLVVPCALFRPVTNRRRVEKRD